jgi:hypothetical protein
MPKTDQHDETNTISCHVVGWCNFFILALLENFFTNRPLGKFIPYLDPGKGARLDGALGSLKGAGSLAPPVYTWTWAHHGGL